MRKVVPTRRAPYAIGPYSQAVRRGPFIFVSGQIPLNPALRSKLLTATFVNRLDRCCKILRES